MTRTDAYLRFALLATTVLSGLPAGAGDILPTGASVAHGNVGITTPTSGAMTIQQSSPNAIVNWRGFSIGEGARVDIHQPSSSSAILNRVTSSTPSTIAGQLNANGQVYLLNPNGILIQKSGTIRTGSFVASTLAMTDEDFTAGRRNLFGNGRSASVINQGSIEVGRGGYAALVGGKVENAGTITAPMGRIALGAGEQATLDLSGDGFLQVTVPSDETPGDDGALITNTGQLVADGGLIELKAATARQMAREVINLSGVAQARTVSGVSGDIVLGGGDGGRVRVTGKLDASAPPAQQLAFVTTPPPRPDRGGSIVVTGGSIELAGATLDASGAEGGGTILVGGDWQGGGTLPHASLTSIDAATLISADAALSGDGGTVVVWSDQHTAFEGRISARGGPAGGDGGSAEVSGKAMLAYSGHTDLSAPAGSLGTLLLDPFNVTISTRPTTSGTLPDEGDDRTFAATDNGSNLNAAALVAALADANVTVQTGDAGTEDGDITVEAALEWASASTLSLQAFGDILIANSITAPNGGLTLAAGFGNEAEPTPQITTSALGAIDVGTFVLDGGDWLQNAATLPAFAASDFQIPGGSFLRVIGGTGVPDDPYLVADAYGLQGIGSSLEIDAALPDLSDSYTLAANIDAAVTAGWNGEAGFDPIGDVGDAPFLGSLRGIGFAIDGLVIARPTETVGLVEQVGFGGQLINISLTNASISGGDSTGGLVGVNDGVVARSRMVGGTVTGISPDGGVDVVVGGLVGLNNSAVTQSFSTAAVSGFALGGAQATAGGLVGENTGTVSVSNSSGAVAGAGGDFRIVGGLVGANSGSIVFSYATGATTEPVAAGDIGALVGFNSGAITQTYASGLVMGGANFNGGLVGVNEGTVASSFWDLGSTGQAGTSGGGTGLTTAEFQSTLGFMTLAGSEGWSFETTWAPPSPGFYPELYAITPVVRVDVDDAARLYGNPNPVFTSTDFGGPGVFVLGPEPDTLSIPLTSPATPASAVGAYPITTGPSATSAAGQTYRLVSTDGTLSVNVRPLTITADDETKTYGDPFSFAGTEFTTRPGQLVNGDTVDSVLLQSGGTLATAPVGISHAIAASAAKGTDLANYAISYEPGAFTVTPRPLVIRADDAVKVFGNELVFAGTEFTSRGLVNGDQVTLVRLDSAGSPADAPVFDSPYAIIASDAQLIELTAGGISNYAISYEPGELVVEPAVEPETFDAGLRLVYATGLPNPSDVIQIAATEGFEAASGGVSLGIGENDVAAAEETLAFVESVSTQLENQVASCDPTPGEVDPFLGCVRDALADYARELDARILDLPAPLRAVSAVIQQSARQIEGVRVDAARRIAAATSDEEIRAIEREAAAQASAAVQTAVVEIRKAIELIRAEDDPQLASLQVEQGTAITAALQNVEDELTRAVGL